MINKISTGSYDFNRWLFGGYESDVISMIAGPPGSGKTNFTLLASCSQAKKGKKVIFIDTEGGFSLERFKQIVGENYKEYLENILLLNPTSFEEQKRMFSKLLEKLKKETIGLIVVDSMAMLYRLEIGDARSANDDERVKEINREVGNQMRMLAEIARKQNIPVLITNQVYGDFIKQEDLNSRVEKKSNIVGGDLFKYWSKCIIELKNDGGRKKAILLKHRSLPEKEMGFIIRDKGLFRKGLF